jgi:hypothetical protein
MADWDQVPGEEPKAAVDVQRLGKELTGKGNLEKAEYGGAAT